MGFFFNIFIYQSSNFSFNHSYLSEDEDYDHGCLKNGDVLCGPFSWRWFFPVEAKGLKTDGTYWTSDDEGRFLERNGLERNNPQDIEGGFGGSDEGTPLGIGNGGGDWRSRGSVL